MSRFFSAKQRRYLFILAGGECQLCGCELTEFHADHVVAYANNGPTALQNGQALCVPCNLRKGAKPHEQDPTPTFLASQST